MHDHNNINLTTGGGITEMQLMWVVMGIMAVHHLWMWLDMRKMKKKEKCDC
jgi:hypothetical protein